MLMTSNIVCSSATGASNLAMLFAGRVEATPDKEAFRYLDHSEWVSVTWRDTATRVESLAAGLLALGIEPEQRVGIASSTRFEWILADLAIMSAGAATTTVYANTIVTDVGYILADSESRIVFAEDAGQVAKLSACRGQLPALTKVVIFDGSGDGDWVITLENLAELGAKFLADHPSCVRNAAAAITPDRLATLIYTSGTTGRPKGVRLHHGAWVYEGATVAGWDVVHEDDLQLLWLPLAHAFGKVVLAAQLGCGFVSAVDGRVDKIVQNAAVVKPTFMCAAPRIFEKAYARIVTTQRQQGGIKAKLFDRAFAVGLDVDRRRQAGQHVGPVMSLQYQLFDRLVFSKVRQAFGGRIREGYGLTEAAGGDVFNLPDRYQLGTVGLPFEGTEVRIGAGGEVQLRGPNVMVGYHNMPETTAAAFTEDGWLRTGDEGSMDDEGFLSITGRIKDMFKTSGGKYIAPSAIEEKFIALCPYASQFLVFGEAHNFCVALVALDADVTASWAAGQGLSGASYGELVKSQAVHDLIEDHVARLNVELNRWETIKKWAFLERDLTVEGGELTPSLKVKRAVVAERYKELLKSFYA
jgi:long-chain acyl-CoA synthetase